MRTLSRSGARRRSSSTLVDAQSRIARSLELQSELADRGRVYAASPTFETREAFLAIRDQVDEWTTVQANAHGAIHEANRRASAAKTAFKITA